MTRGLYSIQDMEASKQAGRDNSYRTCLLTMFIFFILCIILILITWTTSKPPKKVTDDFPSKSKIQGNRGYPSQQHGDAKRNETEKTHTPIRTQNTESTTENTEITTDYDFIEIDATSDEDKENERSLNTSQDHLPQKLKQRILEDTNNLEDEKKNGRPTLKNGNETSQNQSKTGINGTGDHLVSGVHSNQTNATGTNAALQNQTKTDIDDTGAHLVSDGSKNQTHVADKGINSTNSHTVKSGGHQNDTNVTGTNATPPNQTNSDTHLVSGVHSNQTNATGTNAALQNQTKTDIDDTGAHLVSDGQNNQTDVTETGINSTDNHKVISDGHQNDTNVMGTNETSQNQTKTGIHDIGAHPVSVVHNNQTNVTESNTTTHNETTETNVTRSHEVSGGQQNETNVTGRNADPQNQTKTDIVDTGAHLVSDGHNNQTNVTETGINGTDTRPVINGEHKYQTNVTETIAASHNQTKTGINDTGSLTNIFIFATGNSSLTSDTTTNIPPHNQTVTANNENVSETSDSSFTDQPENYSTQRTTSILTESCTPTNTVKPEEKKNYCSSAACKTVSSRMLSLMNHSADPCNDFYMFACGGLIDNQNLLQQDPEQETWSRIADALGKVDEDSPEAFQNLKTFYMQCVEYDKIVNKTSRLKEARKILDGVGKMYTLSDWTSEGKTLNLTALLVKLLQLNSASIFDVQLDVSDNDVTKFSLKLIPPTQHSKFRLEHRYLEQCKNAISAYNKTNKLKDIYLDKYIQCTRNYEDYMNTTQKVLKEFGIFDELADYNWTQNVLMLRRFIEFNVLNILQELPEPGQMRQILSARQYDIFTIDQLHKAYKQVDWTALFRALLHQPITQDTEVQVYFGNYFDKFFEEFGTATDETFNMNMHNALLTMFAHDLYVDLVETRSACDRENYCLKVTSGLMEDVSSSLYLSSFTKEELHEMQNELNTLFARLKLTLEEEFVTAKWLDDSSRSYLINKLQKMISVTDGGNVYYGDPNMLNQGPTAVDVTTSNSYLDNAVALVRRYREKMYLFYSEKTNSQETIWSYYLLPYDTEAVTLYPLNTVVIPFGLLGSPQSNPDLPTYIYKTRIGNAIARQLVHHFDTTGIRYGTSGKDNILSDTAKTNYENWGQCDGNVQGFSMSWTNTKGQTFSYEIDDRLARNARFADSAALLLTHKALQDDAENEPILPWLDLNYNKLHYLLVTQDLCTKGDILDYTIQLYESEQMPPFLRTSSMIKSSEDFTEVYKCKPGQKMYPPVRCDTFPRFTADYSDYETDELPRAE